MLPLKNRIKLSDEKYRRFLREGKRVETDNFLLYRLGRDKVSPVLFSIIVPKRLDNRPAKRNRTRRLIHEAVRQNLKDITGGYEVLIVPNKIFYNEKLKDVQPLIEQALKKADILCKEK